MITDTFTTTLISGQILTIEPTANFGEIIIAVALASLLAMLVFDLVVKVVYRK